MFSGRGVISCRIFFRLLWEGITIIIKNIEINERIRDRQVRLIDDDGAQLGIVSIQEANSRAERKNLDLVKISPSANPPVCKIMDFGKYKFDMQKREKEARKNQKVSELKEVWLSMTIDRHDLETKSKQARRFLVAGDKVKVSIRMRGRQQAHAVLGVKVMEEFFTLCEDLSVMDKRPLTEGRNILMILNPKAIVKTTDQKGAEQKSADPNGAMVSAFQKAAVKSAAPKSAETKSAAPVKSPAPKSAETKSAAPAKSAAPKAVETKSAAPAKGSAPKSAETKSAAPKSVSKNTAKPSTTPKK